MITKISELLNTEDKDPLPKKPIKTINSFNETLHEIRKEIPKTVKEAIKRRKRQNKNRILKKSINNNKSRRR